MQNPTDPYNKATNPQRALHKRRRTALAWFIGILIAGPIVQSLVYPAARHSYVSTLNQWFEVFPDQIFNELVARGNVRPATHKEVLAWINLAKASGNSELSDFDGYMLTQTFVVKDRSELPKGMYGAHSRYFLVKSGMPLPKGVFPSHNTVFFEESGACVGTLPGCSSL